MIRNAWKKRTGMRCDVFIPENKEWVAFCNGEETSLLELQKERSAFKFLLSRAGQVSFLNCFTRRQTQKIITGHSGFKSLKICTHSVSC